MNHPITIEDVISTVIYTGGFKQPPPSLVLNPFGVVDLAQIIPGSGRGMLYAERNSYVGQPLRLCLVEETESGLAPFADFTKVMPAALIPTESVLVKTYGENILLRPGLLASGYFEDTSRRVPAGFAELEVWRLTPAFVAAFASANRTAINATRRAIQRAIQRTSRQAA